MPIISADPLTKTTRRMHYSEHDDTYVMEILQDAEAILEANKAQHASYRGTWEKHGEWGDHVARIPSTIWGDLMRRGVAYDTARLKKWLNDRDNLFMRTRPGRI